MSAVDKLPTIGTMVTNKPSQLPKPTSRGISPPKGSTNCKGDNRVVYEKTSLSPIRSRGVSPSGSISSISSQKWMSTQGDGVVGRKRPGSETGSIERLDDDNKFRRIITSYNLNEDNINVVVRVRPLSKREIQYDNGQVVQFPGNGQIMIDAIPGGPGGGQKPRLFSYNVVFEPAATQDDVLQYSGIKRLIEMAVEGYRCTCFCYGQTGSGKTHTLTGPPGLFALKSARLSDNHGLIVRSFAYLFERIQEQADTHFVLKASYLEIYNEKVIDLLNPGTARKPLAVRWSKKARGFFVENLFTVDCEELDDLMAVLEEGLRNRAVGRHNMNDYSSRSHTILTVYITSEQPAENGVFISRSGKLNFVDLAGSEMTKKTQSSGKTLEEANNINKSLMVLGYCIASLSDCKKKPNHIPYRDSKLTKLLADSLAGNGVTLMIACISPAKSNIFETINTLRYAARAKRIRTKPVVLMDPREALIISLKREVDVLQNENKHLRSVLRVYSASSTSADKDGNSVRGKARTPPNLDLDELDKLDGRELTELVRLYVKENGDLRKENVELFTSRDLLQRDHELVCRENERLLKKLEEVNTVCCRSPLIGARSSFSAEALNVSDDAAPATSQSITNIWTNPDKDNGSAVGNNTKEMPEFLQKEMNKRLGSRNIKGLRPKSFDEDRIDSGRLRIKSTNSDGSERGRNKLVKSTSLTANGEPLNTRRFSIAQGKGQGNVFGSVISLTDEDD